MESKLLKLQKILAAFNSSLAKLVKADELLAKIALKDAVNTPVKWSKFQKFVERRLGKAEGQIIKAEEKLENNCYISAIKHYKLAWKYAQNAIKFAEKECKGKSRAKHGCKR